MKLKALPSVWQTCNIALPVMSVRRRHNGSCRAEVRGKESADWLSAKTSLELARGHNEQKHAFRDERIPYVIDSSPEIEVLMATSKQCNTL